MPDPEEPEEQAESATTTTARWASIGCALSMLAVAFGSVVVVVIALLVFGTAGESAWSIGLAVTMTALTIASLSAVLGIWVDRDEARPPTYSLAMSVLVMLTMITGLMQAYLDAAEYSEMRDDLSGMLDMVDEIAANSDNEDLAALLDRERNKHGRGAKAKGAKTKGKAKTSKTKAGKDTKQKAGKDAKTKGHP